MKQTANRLQAVSRLSSGLELSRWQTPRNLLCSLFILRVRREGLDDESLFQISNFQKAPTQNETQKAKSEKQNAKRKKQMNRHTHSAQWVCKQNSTVTLSLHTTHSAQWVCKQNSTHSHSLSTHTHTDTQTHTHTPTLCRLLQASMPRHGSFMLKLLL